VTSSEISPMPGVSTNATFTRRGTPAAPLDCPACVRRTRRVRLGRRLRRCDPRAGSPCAPGRRSRSASFSIADPSPFSRSRPAQGQLAATQRLPLTPKQNRTFVWRVRLRAVPGGRNVLWRVYWWALLARGGRSRRYHPTYVGLLHPQSAPGGARSNSPTSLPPLNRRQWRRKPANV